MDFKKLSTPIKDKSVELLTARDAYTNRITRIYEKVLDEVSDILTEKNDYRDYTYFDLLLELDDFALEITKAERAYRPQVEQLLQEQISADIACAIENARIEVIPEYYVPSDWLVRTILAEREKFLSRSQSKEPYIDFYTLIKQKLRQKRRLEDDLNADTIRRIEFLIQDTKRQIDTAHSNILKEVIAPITTSFVRKFRLFKQVVESTRNSNQEKPKTPDSSQKRSWSSTLDKNSPTILRLKRSKID